MSKNIDLTGKLGLEGKPTITVGKDTVTVDNSARTLLAVLNEVGDDPGPKEMLAAFELLFSDKDRKAIDAMDLSFEDFALLMETALDLVLGGAEGEGQTRATTS